MFYKTQLSALVGAAFVTLATTVAGQNSVQTNVPKFSYGTPSTTAPNVVATGANGPTNPNAPSLNTPINQTSESRLVSINSVDDWCTFSSPDGKAIADTESYTVAYCTKARNNARVIPDGTVTAAHFVKTPLYVQLMALGDFTKIGLAEGDYGGELDPHGATGKGNPIGGNVTSNVSGKDVFYEEWMNYISYQQVCFRVCIAGSEVAPTPLECQHTLDEMGCNWVMPGNYADNSFDTCDGDSAYPPGLYPLGNGQTSTFQQYYSQDATVNGVATTWINGAQDQQTPSFAYSLPATSNCQTTSTIANGIKAILPSSSSSMASSSSSAGGMSTSKGSSKGSASTDSTSNANTSGSSTSGSSNLAPAVIFASLVSALVGGVVFLQ